MWLLSAAAGLLSGAIGAMGMGGGGVLLIFLTLFSGTEQLRAQGINLLFFLPCGLLAVLIYAAKKQIKPKPVLFMWLGGLPASAVGAFIARVADTSVLSKLFAIFLIVFGLFQLFAKDGKSESLNIKGKGSG